MADKQTNVTKTTKTEVQQAETTERTRDRRVYLPPTDIYETEDAVTVIADMPGVTRDAVSIELEQNILTIHGNSRDHQPEEYSPAYEEYGIGDFERTFRLSDEIDRDNIEAKLNHGVLTLTLPKAKPSRKKIEVKAN